MEQYWPPYLDLPKPQRNCFFVMAMEYIRKKKNIRFSDKHNTIEYWPSEDDMHVLARYNVAEQIIKFRDGQYIKLEEIDQKEFTKKLNKIIKEIV